MTRRPTVWTWLLSLLAVVALAPTPASAAPPVGERDARDLAAVRSAAAQASWSTGPVAPGVTQGWVWNNANPLNAAYQVGLSPTGAGDLTPCQFEVTRTWYSREPGGERRFHFTVANSGTLTCTATVLLSWLTPTHDWSTGTLAPGASGNYGWVEQIAPTVSYLLGVTPTGATATAACQLEITRSWYRQEPDGVRKFYFVLRNIGTITCSGQFQLAQTGPSASWRTGTLPVGASATWTWNNANPLTAVYLPGLAPTGAAAGNACQLEVTRSRYVQRANPDGSRQRQYVLTVGNVGQLPCGGTVLLGSLTP
ncbi:hypothetical protein ACWCHM_17350 [Micromonospora sp. SCSIO 07396]